MALIYLKCMIKLVLGLGNPERRYFLTRHNLGYTLVDLLAKKRRVRFRPGKGAYCFAKAKIKGRNMILVKPQTFMNESGIAARECLTHFELSPEELLVLCDDVNLPLGKLRIRPKGSDGGHKGLESIIYHLDSQDFARLRMGAGFPSPQDDVRDYVLNGFRPVEKNQVKRMLKQASLAVEVIVSSGIQQSMNQFN